MDTRRLARTVSYMQRAPDADERLRRMYRVAYMALRCRYSRRAARWWLAWALYRLTAKRAWWRFVYLPWLKEYRPLEFRLLKRRVRYVLLRKL